MESISGNKVFKIEDAEMLGNSDLLKVLSTSIDVATR